MRLSDIGDYFALRRHVVDAWAFLTARKRPMAGPYLDVSMRDGGPLRLRTESSDRHLFHRIFGRDEYRLDRIPPGSLETVIDVGAHIGLFAARVAPLARRVVCLEPDRANYALLLRNTNRFMNVETRPVAVAGRRGQSMLYVTLDPSAHSMFPADPTRPSTPLPVEALTLADVFAEHRLDRCDLLKLDCEGAEYEILYSLAPDSWGRIRRIAMEYHPVAGAPEEWSGRALADRLRAMGHRVRLCPSKKKPGKGLLFSTRDGG